MNLTSVQVRNGHLDIFVIYVISTNIRNWSTGLWLTSLRYGEVLGQFSVLRQILRDQQSDEKIPNL